MNLEQSEEFEKIQQILIDGLDQVSVGANHREKAKIRRIWTYRCRELRIGNSRQIL